MQLPQVYNHTSHESTVRLLNAQSPCLRESQAPRVPGVQASDEQHFMFSFQAQGRASPTMPTLPAPMASAPPLSELYPNLAELESYMGLSLSSQEVQKNLTQIPDSDNVGICLLPLNILPFGLAILKGVCVCVCVCVYTYIHACQPSHSLYQ